MHLLEKINDYKYLINKNKFPGMRVDGLIYASEKLISHINKEETYKQVINVAHLPGIIRYSIAMPDIHWGYGFPIGGVAAMDTDKGIISPGGVGSDINCGVRSLTTPFTFKQIKNQVKDLINEMFYKVPCGVGVGSNINLSENQLDQVITRGLEWAVNNNYAFQEDLEHCEEGCLKGASLKHVSKTAIKRGLSQLGSLGAGNHFLEIQKVETIYDNQTAEKFGLFQDQVLVMIHTGSRGFGHQICEDYLQSMQGIKEKYRIILPDKQLASAPIDSPEGRQYYSAMAAAANYAWVNRQIITSTIRNIFVKLFKINPREIKLLYDVAHNIAKFEKHLVKNKIKTLLVHRKGATRAFGPGSAGLSGIFQQTGQPIIIPGDMGTASYILAGTKTAMQETFGTVCHGAGRMLSRHQAKKIANQDKLYKELNKKSIILKAKKWRSVAEEIPEAYKDIDEIVNVVVQAGLARKITRLVPVAVIKG